MITKLLSVKNFGIFEDFHWNSAINPFFQCNLIYGWNYSGKTTFSKLFSNLETKTKNHFPAAEYGIEISRNAETFTQESLLTFPYLVKVFNCDYIKNVFSFDSKNNDGFSPISFYLGDVAGDIQPQIDKLTVINQRYDNLKRNRYQGIVNSFNEYAKDDGKFSKHAGEIRRYLNNRISSSEFNKKHVIELVNIIKLNIPSFILTGDNIEETRKKAIEENIWQTQVDNYISNESLANLSIQVSNILADKAVASIPFPELDTNQNLFNWVQAGLHLHEKDDPCHFCGNGFTTDRQEALNKYYSEKLREIQNKIKTTFELIEKERDILSYQFPHESLLTTHLQEKYKAAISNLNLKRIEYDKVLDILIQDLITKENNYFNSIAATQIDIISALDELKDISDILKGHNVFVNNFSSTKAQALQKILKHYVAEYLISEDYIVKENNSNTASQISSKISANITANDIKLVQLESRLKDTVKGQEELNVHLEIFLNRGDIRIEISNNKFILKRANNLATNLSEGEKTAIAFAYFLTELKSLQKESKLSNTIIFIDDPISSLDSNHIFQVRSLISHFFKTNADYLQLFVSTHNFEFFSIMLDCDLFKNANRRDTRPDRCPYYLIHRNSTDTSTIKNLPKSLRSHKSEYAHLFHILKEFNELTDKEDFEHMILLPNALRRFLELYSLFKYPKGFSEIDERIKKIFTLDDAAFHNTKLYHWFSHQNQMEKIAQHDSKLILIDGAINEVIQHLKSNDKLHWLGLTDEVL